MRFIPLIFALAAALGLGACRQQPVREDIHSVSARDDEMNAAMEKARETLPQFWAARDRDGEGFEGLLKVHFFDPGNEENGEHMWVRVTSRDAEHISGILLSQPGWLKSVSAGDQVRFPYDRVSDWLAVGDGMARGAYTVRLLRSRMTPQERRVHDEGYPFRFE